MASIIKVDQLSEKTQGSGITLSHSLKNSSGSEIISPAGTVSNLSKLSLTPSSAPSSPVQGDMYLDSSDNNLKIWTGNFWKNIVDASPGFLVEYLVVAGGGSGGAVNGTGAGAGGFRTSSSIPGDLSGHSSSAESAVFVSSGINYTVAIGAGATGIAGEGSNGQPSQFASIISDGGGGGRHPGGTGYKGGSGGGGGNDGTTPNLGGKGIYLGNGDGDTTNQGYDGAPGNGSGAARGGGGGGGAGAVGTSGSGGNGGNGGSGLTNGLSGSSLPYAGGGGGGAYLSYTYGSGGTGGGGRGGNGGGSNQGEIGYPGTVNTGGGGGGAGSGYGAATAAGSGGSGIVIISYPNTYPDLASIDVSHTCRGATTVSGTTNPPAPSTARTGYKTYEFLDGDGNISW
jgi:hypothetical protein